MIVGKFKVVGKVKSRYHRMGHSHPAVTQMRCIHTMDHSLRLQPMRLGDKWTRGWSARHGLEWRRGVPAQTDLPCAHHPSAKWIWRQKAFSYHSATWWAWRGEEAFIFTPLVWKAASSNVSLQFSFSSSGQWMRSSTCDNSTYYCCGVN